MAEFGLRLGKNYLAQPNPSFSLTKKVPSCSTSMRSAFKENRLMVYLNKKKRNLKCFGNTLHCKKKIFFGRIHYQVVLLIFKSDFQKFLKH